MAAPQADYGEQLRRQKEAYHLTEDEARVLKECNMESFWYRSVPFSTLAMVATQTLISKGYLTTSSRFGSLPKLAFAGFFGFIAGKMSYINTCKEKLMKLENSPLADMLHKGQVPNVHLSSPKGTYNEDFTIPTAPLQGSAPAQPEPPSGVYSSEYESSTVEVPFSATMSESSPTGITDSLAREPEHYEAAQNKPQAKPPASYEELRNKNRGVYDVLSPQTPGRPVPSRAPSKEAKKNQYGDVWEE